eukprot:SAG11_NODE_15046_length_590_cov_3.107943_1_plen_91_part_10
MAASRPFFLASALVDSLEKCIQLSLEYGGEYSAGDATDKLNLDILDPANDTWKSAWKGKTSQTYRILKRLHPNEKIIAVAIAGGPACDWER